MPDVTPKPLRSKGNAVINLMGASGGILYLVIASVMYSAKRTEGLEHVDYFPLFLVVGGIMILSMIIIVFAVDEVKLNRQMLEYEKAHPEEELTEKSADGTEVIPPAVKKSLVFLLISIALWFIGYNAVETWFTTYAEKVWGMKLGGASLCLTIATAGAIVSYMPIGIISSRIGRKKTIMGGVLLLGSCFAIVFIYACFFHHFHPWLYVLFVIIGFSWAAINVNSLPMVLEMCKGSEIGKFTGYYYTFSMAAQIVTPVLAGFLLHNVGYSSLFPYSAVFVFLSFVTMMKVAHGDAKVEAKKGLEAFDVED